MAAKKKKKVEPKKVPIRFDPAGPFLIKIDSNKFGRSISDTSVAKFWAGAETSLFKSRIGCYIFVIGRKPFYVGKATKTFGQEVFNSNNLSAYRELVTKFPGDASFYLIAHKKIAGKRGARPTSVIAQIEKLLIGLAHDANPDLANVHHKNKEDRFSIAGVYNSGRGKPSRSAAKVRAVLKLAEK